MSFNLMDLVKDQVMGQLAGKAAGFLGESESGVTKALAGIFPMLLGSVVDKASDNDGASGIMNMLKGADGNIINNISGMFGDGEGSPEGLVEQGSSMLSGLLGDKVGGLSSLVSKFSGVSEGSTSSLMGMAAPMIMGMLGKQVKSEGLGISGLQGLLEGQKDSIASAMPEGLADLAGGAGLLGSLGGIVSGIAGAGKDALGAVSGAAGDAVGAVGDAGKKVVGGAADAVSGAAGAVGNAGKKVVGGATDLAGKGVDAGKKVVGGAANAVSGAAGAVGNAGKNVVGGAANLAGKGAGAAADLGKGAVEAGGSIISTILKWAIPILAILFGAYFIKGCMDGKSLTEAAGDAVGSTTDMVKDGTGAVGDLAGDAVGAVGDAAGAVAGAAGDAAGAVGDAAGDLAGAAGDLVSGAFSKVNEAAKATLDGISFAAGSAGEQFMGFVDGGFKGDARFRFNNLTFATGSATIAEASMSEVDNIAAIMKAYPEVKINVEGYTDNTGNADSNVALSNSRAIAVKNRLVEQGVAANRISAEGFGAANPVADNGTAEGRKQNRRIEVTIAK